MITVRCDFCEKVFQVTSAIFVKTDGPLYCETCGEDEEKLEEYLIEE